MENCPYCNKEIEINHDDGVGYEEDEIYQQTCKHCGKTFVYTTRITFYYDLSKASCLNDEAEHVWKELESFPKNNPKKYVCKICGEMK